MTSRCYTVSLVVQVDATSPNAAAEQVDFMLLTADSPRIYGVALGIHLPSMPGQLNIEVVHGKSTTGGKVPSRTGSPKLRHPSSSKRRTHDPT